MRRVKLRDVPILLVILGSFLAVAYTLVDLRDGQILNTAEKTLAGVGLLLGLAASASWYLVEATKRNEVSLKDVLDRVGSLEVFHAPEHIFDLASATLKRRGGWTKVRIFAPTGLWDVSERKWKWFRDLRKALRKESVGELVGVFGLPEEECVFNESGVPRLKLFADTPRTRLHYLPPPDESHPVAVPAFGLIVFERESSDDGLEEHCEVLFAFNSDPGDYVVGHGFAIRSLSSGRVVAQWFDEHVFGRLSSSYVIRGPRGGCTITMDEGLTSIHGLYNSERPIRSR
jgi:hypothetical protein